MTLAREEHRHTPADSAEARRHRHRRGVADDWFLGFDPLWDESPGTYVVTDDPTQAANDWIQAQLLASRWFTRFLILTEKHAESWEKLSAESWDKLSARVWAQSVSRSFTPPVREAHERLELLGARLSDATKAKVITFLARVTDRRSTFASIVPEDGVAVLHWVAGDLSLQVDVTEEGPDYVWFSDSRTTQTATRPEAIHNIATRALLRMSEAAYRADPNWADRMRQA